MSFVVTEILNLFDLRFFNSALIFDDKFFPIFYSAKLPHELNTFWILLISCCDLKDFIFIFFISAPHNILKK